VSSFNNSTIGALVAAIPAFAAAQNPRRLASRKCRTPGNAATMPATSDGEASSTTKISGWLGAN
jgi:hypothetical protein